MLIGDGQMPNSPTVPTDEECDKSMWHIANAVQEGEFLLAKKLLREVRDRTREATLPIWMPIESEPHDNKLILGFAIIDSETGNWSIKIMSYDSYAEVGMGRRWNGWPHYTEPTHWMPLPSAPKDSHDKQS